MVNQDVGTNIRDIRKQRGLNQDQLAEMASLNRVTVAKYESGKVEPGAKALARIADALEVTVDALLGREQPPAAPVRDAAAELMADLTPEELAQVQTYAAFLKAQRKSD